MVQGSRSRADSLWTTVRAEVAGVSALAIRSSARTLFEAAGKHALSPSARTALRRALDRGMSTAGARPVTSIGRAALAGAERGAFVRAGAAARAPALEAAVRGSRMATRIAARSVLRGIGRGAALGFAIDGAIGGIEAYRAHRDGELSAGEAVAHAATEAITGALACGAGVALAATAVAATGGLGAITVFGIGALGATGVKVGLARWKLHAPERGRRLPDARAGELGLTPPRP